jgi:hypothetical protein
MNSSANASNAIQTTASGTITLKRHASGAVTLTCVDDDANAALTVAAGGSGALTLGDSDSTTAITSSDWAIGATGDATGLGAITCDGDIISSGSDIVLTNGSNGGSCSITMHADKNDNAGDSARILVGDNAGFAFQTDIGSQGTLASVLTIGTDGALAANGNVTLGDTPASDTHVINGAVLQKGDITLMNSAANVSNVLQSTANGTVTLKRHASGTVTLTCVDDDANAALTVAAGGTGALTVGDSDSATTITGSSVAIPQATTADALALAVAADTTSLMVQAFKLDADVDHTVMTQALTKAYGHGVEPKCFYSPSASGNTWYISAVASNSVQVTVTADKDGYLLVVGPRP